MDINAPARKSMMDKTVFPDYYSPDAGRVAGMYREDAVYVWEQLKARWTTARKSLPPMGGSGSKSES